jgi:hypothetical protein
MPLRHRYMWMERPSTPPLMPGTPAAGIGDLSGSLVCSSEAGELLNQTGTLAEGRRYSDARTGGAEIET